MAFDDADDVLKVPAPGDDSSRRESEKMMQKPPFYELEFSDFMKLISEATIKQKHTNGFQVVTFDAFYPAFWANP